MNAQDAWNTAFSQLEMQLDRPSFNTWLRDAAFMGCDAGVYVVGVRTSYARDMLQHRLYRNVRRVLSDVVGETVELRFEVQKAAQDEPASRPQTEADMPLFQLLAQQETSGVPLPLHQQVARPKRPDLPESDLNPRFTFDRFITGGENTLAYSAARAIAEQPGTAYNPFFIYGGVGLGKTHLLQAIAHECRTRDLRVVYISSEAFTNDLVDGIRQRTTAMFREKYRSADVLLVDDIQFIAGKDSTQEEFFHTFNALHTFNKQVILAADRHPSKLDGVVDRLRSRFQCGLMVDIQMPEFETRIAMLKMWAQERGVSLPQNVCEMLANRAKNNIRELESVFNQVVAASQLARQPLNSDMAHAVMEGYRRPRNHISIAQVLDLTARTHGLTVDDLTGPRRTGAINEARQIAMYLAREVTGASLPQIGEVFGGRKHSTVLHSCNKVSEYLNADERLRHVVASIREKLVKGQ